MQHGKRGPAFWLLGAFFCLFVLFLYGPTLTIRKFKKDKLTMKNLVEFASISPEGARVLGDGEPRIGAHGKPVLFLHPKDFVGTLVELEQV